MLFVFLRAGALAVAFVLLAIHAAVALQIGGPPEGEDPEVVAFAKKKGWPLYTDVRTSDRKSIVVWNVGDPAKAFEKITLAPDDYKMIAKAKTVQFLDLRGVNATDEGLKVISILPRLEGIFVTGDDVTDAGIKALAASKTLENVMLFTAKVTDAGVKELAALPKLHTLYLLGLTQSGAAFEAFAGSQTLETVQLNLVHGLTDDGIRHLGKLPKLKELSIAAGVQNEKLTAVGIKAIIQERVPAKFQFDTKLIDDELFAALVTKGWLYGPSTPGDVNKKPAKAAEVSEIVVSGSKVTDKGLEAILDCVNVQTLLVDRTAVTDETLKKMTGFKKLSYLALGQTKVTAAGLEAVAGCPIKHVALENCELSEDMFKALGKMVQLEELWLARTKMKAEWLKHIAALPKLNELNLWDADFDDAAVKYVTSLPMLKSLNVNSTKLGDKGFVDLVALPNLGTLLVDSTQISREVYQKAKKEHPKLFMSFYKYDN